MATYSYYYPTPVYNGNNGSFSVKIGNSNTSFYVCRDSSNSSDMIFKAGYCGNPSTTSWNTMKTQYSLPWSSDTSISNSTDLAFKVYYDPNVSDIYFIDWANPIKREQAWSHQLSVSTNLLSSGNILEIEESSGGNGSIIEPSEPCDNPYDGVITAIYTCAAVPFVIGLFIVIYRTFMRLRG